jgi:hypothetical protein
VKRNRKIDRRVGDVVAIRLSDGRLAFAWLLREPLMAFFDYSSRGPAAAVAEIVRNPIAFRIWVMKRALTVWQVVGHVSVPDDVLEPPWFFKQDPLSRAVSILRTGTEEFPANAETAKGLERAAVWDPEHVADRLEDHFAGRPNKWVDSVKLR